MPKNHPELTAERLRELLSYDPITGVFHWLVDASRSVKKGRVAGCKNTDGYLVIGINGKKHKAHRLAWMYAHGDWPTEEIDHRNGVRDANWIANLRKATHAENQQNIGISPANSSGHKGVYWNKKSQRWRAYIYVGNRQKYLGRFVDIAEAVAARAEAKAALHTFQPVERSVAGLSAEPRSTQ